VFLESSDIKYSAPELVKLNIKAREDEAFREKVTATSHRYIERCRSDSAAFDARRKQSNIDRSQKYALDREFRKRIGFRGWVTRHYTKIREGLAISG
jgi:hypothetical protein